MEASPFVAVRASWAEGHPYAFLHYHYHSGEIVQWCVGVMRNGGRQRRCSTKPFMYRVPPEEVQGSRERISERLWLVSVFDSQSEVTKVMIIVRKSGN